jgi:hypothetical protein
MASLKSLIPELAQALDMKPAAMYERQRALVRARLLEMRPGRGPGSGVLATPKSLAMLLIAILATESLSETEERARVFANLKVSNFVDFGSGKPPRKVKQCPITGKRTFFDALTAAFATEDLSSVLGYIRAQRQRFKTSAEIGFSGDDDRTKIIEFTSRTATIGPAGVTRLAILGRETLAAIASILREAPT